MSVSVRFVGGDAGPDEIFHLASGGGWLLARRWIETLDPDAFPALHALADGRADDTEALSAELDDALDDQPPGSADVRHTLDALYDHLGVGHPDESAVIVDDSHDDD